MESPEVEAHSSKRVRPSDGPKKWIGGGKKMIIHYDLEVIEKVKIHDQSVAVKTERCGQGVEMYSGKAS